MSTGLRELGIGILRLTDQPGNRFGVSRIIALARVFPLMVLFLSMAIARGQAPILNSVNDQTQTPIAGAGHDYQHLLGETVNFSNGSVSFKLSFPVRKARGITLPIAWSYNSGAVNPLDSENGNTPTWDYGIYHPWPQKDGWNTSDGSPMATVQVWSVNASHVVDIFPSVVPTINQPIPCNFQSGMTFKDQSGIVHNLGTGAQTPAYIVLASNVIYTCGSTPVTLPANGDGQVVGTLLPTEASSYLMNSSPGTGPFVVMDKAGAVYSFPGGFSSYSPGNNISAESVEDRNGNIVSGGNDTTGQVIGASGQSLSSPFTINSITYTPNWTTVSVNYAVSSTVSGQSSVTGITCSTFPATVSGTRNVLSSLALPNGQQYTFYYGNTNPSDSSILNNFGLLNEIVYPDGGWVKYTWALPSGFNEMATMDGFTLSPTGASMATSEPYCSYQYQAPVLASRKVSYDGSTVAQTQSFSLSTNWAYASDGSVNGWTSKTTTVSTTDNKVGSTAKTIYTYSPTGATYQPFTSGATASQIPLESSIVYYDWGQTSPTKTVTKTWADQFNLASETTTINATNQVSGTVYNYSTAVCTGAEVSTLKYLTEQDDYDYGTGSLGPLKKRTIYNYHCFPVNTLYPDYMGTTPSQLVEFPGITLPPQVSSVTVEDGSSPGVILAATQYGYDNYGTGGLANVTATQHDPDYDTSYTIRGNLTSVTKCNPLPATPTTACTGPTVTYTYDITGQPTSMTDACGNGSCADMSGSNHTTTFSFADSPVGGDSAGNSNAYLTSITYPSVNGTTLTKSFQYNYALGYLTSATDENAQTTNYAYNDSLNRPTDVKYPDLGEVQTSYSDTAPNPSITQTKLINSSSKLSQTVTTTMDGMEHPIQVVSSDPDGATTIVKTYDGEGRVYVTTNPFRGSSSSGVPTTTTYHDAFGRPIKTVEQDSSVLQWCYDGLGSSPAASNCSASQYGSASNGTWVDSTDERGNHWQRVSNVFGDLTKVMEPSGSNQAPTMETDYGYNALNELLSVAQLGGTSASSNARVRSFTYDNLARLSTATNPETGTITYAYDLNGNVSSKTDARSVVVSYSYDSLNRLLSKSYSDNATALACYQYDTSSASNANSTPNWLGRLTNSWTLSASTTPTCASSAPTTGFLTKRSVLGYDPMGRVLNEQQFTPGSQKAGAAYLPAHSYDQAGNLLTSTSGMGPIYSYTMGSADRLVQMTSSWNTSLLPGTLFSAPGNQNNACNGNAQGAAYDPSGALLNAVLGGGLNLNRQIDSRLRVTCEQDTVTGATAATSGSATVLVTGAEQSK